MSVANTSREAYIRVKPKLGDQHRKVYAAVGNLGVASNEQIAEYTGLPISSVCGRVNELVKAGWLGFEKRVTAKSGNTVKGWSARTPNDKQLVEVAKEPEHKPAAVSWLND